MRIKDGAKNAGFPRALGFLVVQSVPDIKRKCSFLFAKHFGKSMYAY